MNIAELFVRIRGDTSDVTRQLKGVETSMGGVGTAALRMEGGVTRAHLSTGKLRQEFQTLVRQVTGVPAIFTQLAGVMGEFAAGGAVTLGVLAGVGAIVGAYAKLTEGARKAREETDKLIKSLVDQAKAAYQATVAGQDLIKLQAEVEQQAAKRATGIGIRSIIGGILGRPGLDVADAAALSKRIADAQTAVEQATINVGKAWEAANPPVKEHAAAVAVVAGKYNELRDAAAKVFAETTRDTKDFWRGYIEQTKAALTLTQQLNDEIMAEQPSLLETFRGMLPTVPTVDISDSVKIAGDQAKKINDAAADNANKLHDAIWGSAAALANSVVSALNIGGGGKGSNLGGAIGSTTGFALGFAFGGGPVGGAIGSLIGNIGGSFLGGLFDHKKAVETNTAAVNRNTAAQLLNAPSGFKVANARYNATDVSDLGRAVRKFGSRGGVNPLLVGT